ncbi:protein-L-isoaspartate(D-aspartate) O-methyltransferase [Pirellulaceae bacterium]|nr:protein-L-isoaspartate(D-aspartate) O-methyltransferase [Pirellulaceae bacterium]
MNSNISKTLVNILMGPTDQSCLSARWWSCVVLVALQVFVGTVSAQTRDPYVVPRRKMVQQAVVGSGITNERVIASMAATPRHEFVPGNIRNKAYFDMSLPIGDQQTISAPFIVSFMTEALDPQSTDKVLEIGTGSGYQAAVLAPLVKHVFTIEIVESLGNRARATLKRLKYDNVLAKVGDGFKGWPQYAPFDKIIVTCSPERVPQPLVDQLREGGLMVIPVGERYQQTMYVLRKKNGKMQAEALRPTLFVPMTGNAEDNRQIKPDPLKPALFNGDFELTKEDYPFVIGWYYQRNVEPVDDDTAAQGKRHAMFSNDELGKSAHMLQGFPIDGREVGALRFSAQIKLQDVRPGNSRDKVPLFLFVFYDENRKEVGTGVVGPFVGSQPWSPTQKLIRVPVQARESILRVGLFGGIGDFSIDDVKIQAVKR